MSNSSKIIVITGAESTGKTTLAEALANHFRIPYIPEIARDYIEKLNRKYNYNDVEIIAKKQILQLDELNKQNIPYIFIDTWLLNTKVWFEEVFGKTPSWLITTINETKIDLFLVCDIDLPWIYDPVRENGGEQRKILHNKYIENIKQFGFKFEIVSGRNELRLKNALKILKFLK